TYTAASGTNGFAGIIEGDDTGGTFTLTYPGVGTTAAITLVAPASTAGNTATTVANIQTALNSLLGNGTTVVAAATVPFTAAGIAGLAEYITITFTGTLAGQPQPLMTLNVASLTVAASATATG